MKEGQIVRQAETETLRRDVKQIIAHGGALRAITENAKVLDSRPDRDELALTLEGAETVIDSLRSQGVQHRVVDLNLDEIFEAYVMGKTGAVETGEPESIPLAS